MPVRPDVRMPEPHSGAAPDAGAAEDAGPAADAGAHLPNADPEACHAGANNASGPRRPDTATRTGVRMRERDEGVQPCSVRDTWLHFVGRMPAELRPRGPNTRTRACRGRVCVRHHLVYMQPGTGWIRWCLVEGAL